MRFSAKAGQHLFEVSVERDNGAYVVEVDGERHVVDAQKLEGNFYSLLTGGRSYEVSIEAVGDGYHVRHGASGTRVRISDPGRRAREGQRSAEGPQQVASVMPGRVVRLLVAQGDSVTEGQGVAIVEAMKMENEIQAPKAGRVKELRVTAGQTVESGAVLLVID